MKEKTTILKENTSDTDFKSFEDNELANCVTYPWKINISCYREPVEMAQEFRTSMLSDEYMGSSSMSLGFMTVGTNQNRNEKIIKKFNCFFMQLRCWPVLLLNNIRLCLFPISNDFGAQCIAFCVHRVWCMICWSQYSFYFMTILMLATCSIHILIGIKTNSQSLPDHICIIIISALTLIYRRSVRSRKK